MYFYFIQLANGSLVDRVLGEDTMYYGTVILRTAVQKDLLYTADQAQKLSEAALFGKGSPNPFSDGISFNRIEVRLRMAADALNQLSCKRFGKVPVSVRDEVEAARQEFVDELSRVSESLSS